MQILKVLREEHRYTGCYTVVQEYLHHARIAANPKAAARRSRNKPHRKAASPSADQVNQAPGQARSHAAFRMSLRSQPILRLMPEDEAQNWMREIERGSIRLEDLEAQLPGMDSSELKEFLSFARKGPIRMRNRAIVTLGCLCGIKRALICSSLNISRSSVGSFLRAFRKGGTEELFARRPRSDKKSNNESFKSAVFALLHSPPASHGINRTTWRLEDLHRVLKEEYKKSINCYSISKIIKEAGWKWRHARVVLTSNDPEYREKVDAIKKILSHLEPNEAFFSIDEFGPFAVKQKGGVKRVAPGEQYVVPQWQKTKGWLILTAALELSRNRVTHFFSRKKNTGEMIKMANILRDNYRGFKTLYLSWDAASWHISKDLAAHLISLNERAVEEGFPLIKMAPLPAGAQFLNVIESIFSGMARAIIHNSNYSSPEEAIEAIDRYFEQRNGHFATHPKKAGDKIWGMERVPSQFAEEQNCKDPAYSLPF